MTGVAEAIAADAAALSFGCICLNPMSRTPLRS
jgi:hypothetical protein